MRIDKTVRGELFAFRFNLIPNKMSAVVEYWSKPGSEICNITPDFKYIILSDNFTLFFCGVGWVKVGRLKLNRQQQSDARDYNKN